MTTSQTVKPGGLPMLSQDPYSLEALDAEFQKLITKRDLIEKEVAPIREELATAATEAEVYRVKAMKVVDKLNAKLSTYFDDKDPIKGRRQYTLFKNRLAFIAKTRQALRDKAGIGNIKTASVVPPVAPSIKEGK